MHNYAIFGGCLRSDLSFPELRLTDSDRPDWTLRTDCTASPVPADESSLLGEFSDRFLHVRLHRTVRGLRIVYADTGTFDISERGSQIDWYPGVDSDEDAARLDVMGPVLAMALHASGAFCLHGSGVELAEGGIGFIAPKRHGKSTLARALTNAGGRLATDDTLPVMFGDRPMMRPGVHQVRLWRDSAAHFANDGRAHHSGYAGKQVLSQFESERLVFKPVPLRALYVLAPVRGDAGTAVVQRLALPPVQATLSLIAHAKGAGLLGGSESPVILDRAGELARAVPVYQLRVVRDFGRLEEVVEQVLAWHGGPVDAPRRETVS
jgi:hypothetical protein